MANATTGALLHGRAAIAYFDDGTLQRDALQINIALFLLALAILPARFFSSAPGVVFIAY
ncbi:MAG: hypothetical protein WAK04_17210 [Xanthobacteraceae bacterium]